jgi:hypothetical protein
MSVDSLSETFLALGYEAAIVALYEGTCNLHIWLSTANPTPLWIPQQPPSDTATPVIKKVRRKHYLFTCCTRSLLISWFQKKLAEFIKLIKRFWYLQVCLQSSDIWRWLSGLKWELFEAFSKVEILMFFGKRALTLTCFTVTLPTIVTFPLPKP